MSPIWKVWRASVSINEVEYEWQAVKVEPIPEGKQVLEYAGISIPMNNTEDTLHIYPYLGRGEGTLSISGIKADGFIDLGADATIHEIKLCPKEGESYLSIQPTSRERRNGLMTMQLERHQESPVLFEGIMTDLGKERE